MCLLPGKDAAQSRLFWLSSHKRHQLLPRPRLWLRCRICAGPAATVAGAAVLAGGRPVGCGTPAAFPLPLVAAAEADGAAVVMHLNPSSFYSVTCGHADYSRSLNPRRAAD